MTQRAQPQRIPRGGRRITGGRATATVGVFLLLTVALLDGVFVGAQRRLGLPTPYVLIVPPALLVVVLLRPRVPVPVVLESLAATAIGLTLSLVYLNFRFGDVLGLAQLTVVSVLLLLLRGAELDRFTIERVSIVCYRYLHAALLFQCAQLIAWTFWRLDLSPTALLNTGAGGPDSGALELYGFRATAFSVEPVWLMMAEAAALGWLERFSPDRSGRAVLILGASAILARSLTGVGMFTVGTAVLSLRRGWITPSRVLLSALVASALMFMFSARAASLFSGGDPSTNQRLTTAGVALDLIAESFPSGTGYGEFTDRADWPSDAGLYYGGAVPPGTKSDVLVLNLIAELGLPGLGIVLWLFGRFGVPGGVGSAPFFAALMLGSGSLLVPSVFLLSVSLARRSQADVSVDE